MNFSFIMLIIWVYFENLSKQNYVKDHTDLFGVEPSRFLPMTNKRPSVFQEPLLNDGYGQETGGEKMETTAFEQQFFFKTKNKKDKA